MLPADLKTKRLVLRRLLPSDADTLTALARDTHIRRYLLDGEVVPDGWAANEIEQSDIEFEAYRFGLGLAYEIDAPGEPIGFAGFKVFDDLQPEPQLLYAILEPFTGRGYATELTRTLVRHARDELEWDDVFSAVDAPNAASLRVLEKCGFERWETVPGAFGDIVMLVCHRSADLQDTA